MQLPGVGPTWVLAHHRDLPAQTPVCKAPSPTPGWEGQREHPEDADDTSSVTTGSRPGRELRDAGEAGRPKASQLGGHLATRLAGQGRFL